MKKLFIAAAALMVSVAAYSGPTKSTVEFQNYISKVVSSSTSFATEGLEGTVKVKVTLNAKGEIEAAELVSGVGGKIDEQIVALIKSTPVSVASKMAEDKTVSFIVPVKLVIQN